MPKVFQQVIIDTVQATPYLRDSYELSIRREDANLGVLVQLSGINEGRNPDAFASVLVEKTNGTKPIFGVLMDYHNDRQCTIARVGRLYVATTHVINDPGFRYYDIGKAILASSTSGEHGKAILGGTNADRTGVIIGGGFQTRIGGYFIVDLNLPEPK